MRVFPEELIANLRSNQGIQCANLVELETCCKTQMYLHKSASIQPRTSPPKFGNNVNLKKKAILADFANVAPRRADPAAGDAHAGTEVVVVHGAEEDPEDGPLLLVDLGADGAAGLLRDDHRVWAPAPWRAAGDDLRGGERELSGRAR